VEAVYSAHAAIHQIYIYGNSHRAYLLAVIVPSPQWIDGLKQVGHGDIIYRTVGKVCQVLELPTFV
jgi:long-subunit acyl-CoA synthetase (AMP-forming)